MDGFGFVAVVVDLVCLDLDLVCCLEVGFGFYFGLVGFLVDGFGFVVDVLVGCLSDCLEDDFDLD